MVKPQLDSGLHSEILSWDSFSMCGLHGGLLPRHTPAWSLSNPAATPVSSLISFRFMKNTKTAHLPVRCSWELGCPGRWLFSCPLSRPGSPEQVAVSPARSAHPPLRPREPSASALSSPRKGSRGSFPDLQTRLSPELAACP